MTRKVTICRRCHGPDVLARDEPLPDRLFAMAADALAGRHEAEVEREAERAFVGLGWRRGADGRWTRG